MTHIVVTRRDVTRRIPAETTDHLGLVLGYGKSKVTLCGYGTPPSILKKTAGVLEIRPEQAPYVWFPLSIEASSKLPGEKRPKRCDSLTWVLVTSTTLGWSGLAW